MLNYLYFSGYLILSLGISEQRIQKGLLPFISSVHWSKQPYGLKCGQVIHLGVDLWKRLPRRWVNADTWIDTGFKKTCASYSLLGVFLHFCSLLLLSVRNRYKPQERQAGQCSIHSWSDLLGRTGRELIKTHSLYYCLILWVLTVLKGGHPSHLVLIVSISYLLRGILLP